MFLPPPSTRFPLWQYLSQPVFSRQSQLTLNPWQFQRQHRVNWLERCLSIVCASSESSSD